MRVFLLDLWLDLREKKLAPLAILLLAGIIAVPVVLAKKASPPPPPPAPVATTASAAPVIQSSAATGPVDSKLQTFSPRDPFAPTGHVATATTGTTTGTGTSSTGTSTSTTTTGSGTTGTTGSGTTGGGTTGTQPSTGTTGTGNSGNTGNTTGETKTTLFTYTVDIRFGQAGAVTAYKNVQRLDLIPDSKSPKVVFLGVTTTGKTAVFLIDSNIGVDTAGGKCRPSADQCNFLYLRPDSSHDEAILTDADGTVYHLRLLAIHRVSVSSANGAPTNSGSGNTSKGKTRSNAFTGSASADSQPAAGDAPAGEPSQGSSFQQFFADSGTQ